MFKRAIGYAIVNLKGTQGTKFISRILRTNVYQALRDGKMKFADALKDSTKLEVWKELFSLFVVNKYRV